MAAAASHSVSMLEAVGLATGPVVLDKAVWAVGICSLTGLPGSKIRRGSLSSASSSGPLLGVLGTTLPFGCAVVENVLVEKSILDDA